MAKIVRFEPVTKDRVGRHSNVDCGYSIVRYEDRPAVLLETYGSDDRASPGKISQSLLLDESAAKGLQEVLRRAFPGVL
jgi:hypothetical protein